MPPTPVNGMLFMPDSFSSKVFDNNSIKTNSEFKIAMVKPTVFGPAILLYVPFGNLVEFDSTTGYLNVVVATFCARVSYYILCKSNGIEYADQVVIDSLSTIARSCHPGSHYVVPKASYLTALLQYSQAPTYKDLDNRKLVLTYLTPQQGEALFPHCLFDTNKFVDDYVAQCVIDDQVSFYKTSGGLGEWSDGFLRRLRRNILEANYYGSGHEVFGNASKEDGGEFGVDSDSGGDGLSVQEQKDRNYLGAGQGISESGH